jgi:hypothetical protein
MLLNSRTGLCVIIAMFATAQAKTLVVGQPGTPCPNVQYATITQAVSSASAGDVITVCPALYAEQLVITHPLTIRGIEVNGVNRILIQPSSLGPVGGSVAAITVMNTGGVTLDNLAIDASKNGVSDCTSLATVHFLNASGQVVNSAITGAQLANPASCPTFLSNGFGILADTDGSLPGPFQVSIAGNSIHNFTKNGVYAVGAPENVMVDGNSISGIGPSSGVLQFGVFLIGATGRITNNHINEGNCGSLSLSDCINLRSEGVVLRGAGDGTMIASNEITNAQAGIFLNGGNRYQVKHNIIRNIDAMEGIHMQDAATGSLTNSVIEGNTIFNTTPIENENCGIGEVASPGTHDNKILNNTINDAYCGVSYVSTDLVVGTQTFNTLYVTLDSSLPSPPPVEP